MTLNFNAVGGGVGVDCNVVVLAVVAVVAPLAAVIVVIVAVDYAPFK